MQTTIGRWNIRLGIDYINKGFNGCIDDNAGLGKGENVIMVNHHVSNGEVSIFAGRTGRAFAEKMCKYLGVRLGDSETLVFSEGNIFVRVNETIRSKDVFIVQPIGADPNNEFVELLFWIDAFKRASSGSVTAIIPFFSYAKGDKKDEPRVSIRARVCAESIELAGADRVITMELHSPQVQGFFKKPVDNLLVTNLISAYIKEQDFVDDDLVVVSPDGGYAKRARAYANCLHTNFAIGEKIRTTHDENAKILSIIGDVKDKNCLIVDDFSISGGTLVSVAEGLKQKGAKRIWAALAHPNMRENGVKKIEESPIERVIVTDTLECPAIEQSTKIEMISAAPLFAESVWRIQNQQPLGEMFDRIPERVCHASFSKEFTQK